MVKQSLLPVTSDNWHSHLPSPHIQSQPCKFGIVQLTLLNACLLNSIEQFPFVNALFVSVYQGYAREIIINFLIWVKLYTSTVHNSVPVYILTLPFRIKKTLPKLSYINTLFSCSTQPIYTKLICTNIHGYSDGS